MDKSINMFYMAKLNCKRLTNKIKDESQYEIYYKNINYH